MKTFKNRYKLYKLQIKILATYAIPPPRIILHRLWLPLPYLRHYTHSHTSRHLYNIELSVRARASLIRR